MTPFKHIFGIDLRTLALFRIGLGVLILADLIWKTGDIGALYSDAGVFPRADAIANMHGWRLSLHMLSGAAWIQAALFLMNGLFAVALILGYRTRLVMAVCWLLLISMINRNLSIIQAGDMLIAVLAFWAMFLPLGARFSVDAALNPEPRREDNRYFSAATAALLLQAIYVYVIGALLKDAPQWIPDGTAVYYALHLDSFATPVGHMLRDYPLLLKGLTYYVWGLELIAPLLMFFPLYHVTVRLLGMTLLILMHVGFLLTLVIGLFPFISILSLLAFTPTWLWNRIGERMKTPARTGITLYYDERCKFCRKTCLLIRTFFLAPEVRILPAQASDPEIGALLERENSWVVTDHAGNRHTHWDAVIFCLAQSPIFKPLGWFMAIKPLRWLGNRLYSVIGGNRERLGRLTAFWLPYRSFRVEARPVTNLAVSVLTLFVLVMNLMTLPGVTYKMPTPLAGFSRLTNLDQRWNMFAPRPTFIDGWYVIPGWLGNGTPVDVYNAAETAPSLEKPRYVVDSYKTYRWRKYLSRLPREQYQSYRAGYARYLCRSWNRDREGDDRLKSFFIYYYQERTLPDYQGNDLTQRRLVSWRCY